jgi:Spy/CpxP family protein refolding chaperone
MKARNLVLIVAGAALALGSTLALAGPGPRGHGGPQGHGMRGPLGPLGMALQSLDLTQDQQQRIKDILEQERPTFQALRQQLREGRQAFREAHPLTAPVDAAAIRAHVEAQAKIMADIAIDAAQARAKVLAVLTPEQITQLQQMRENFLQNRGGPHGGPGF